MLSVVDLQGIPCLVLANKKDFPNSMSLEEITESLQLETERQNRLIEIYLCSCEDSSTLPGVGAGLEWLIRAMNIITLPLWLETLDRCLWKEKDEIICK